MTTLSDLRNAPIRRADSSRVAPSSPTCQTTVARRDSLGSARSVREAFRWKRPRPVSGSSSLRL